MEEVYVGIDAGWQTHSVVVLDALGKVVFEDEVDTRPESLFGLRDRLLSLEVAPEHVQIMLEDPMQPVVDVLIDVGFCLWAINPKQTDRLREMRWMANPKDDLRDAFVIADEFRIRPSLFWRIERQEPLLMALRQATRMREHRKEKLQDAENLLRDLLRRYFPQYMQLGWAFNSRVMIELVTLISHPGRLNEVSIAEVKRAIGQARKHSPEEVIAILGNNALPLPAELLESVAELIEQQVTLVRQIRSHMTALDDKIECMLDELAQKNQGDGGEPSDVDIIRSIPGIGNLLAATVLAEGAEAIITRDLALLRKKSIAPVTARTGVQGKTSKKKKSTSVPVRRRNQGIVPLQNALFHIGRCGMQRSPHYKQRYADMRRRGHTHGRACRQVADQMLTVLFAMLRDRTLYDPNLHGATRKTGYKPVQKPV